MSRNVALSINAEKGWTTDATEVAFGVLVDELAIAPKPTYILYLTTANSYYVQHLATTLIETGAGTRLSIKDG